MRAGVLASVGAGVDSDHRSRRRKRERSLISSRLSRAQVELFSTDSFAFGRDDETGTTSFSANDKSFYGGIAKVVSSAMHATKRRLSMAPGARLFSLTGGPSRTTSGLQTLSEDEGRGEGDLELGDSVKRLSVSATLQQEIMANARIGDEGMRKSEHDQGARMRHRIVAMLENESVKEERRIKALEQIYERYDNGEELRIPERISQLQRGVTPSMPSSPSFNKSKASVAPSPMKGNDKGNEDDTAEDADEESKPLEKKETLLQTFRMSLWVLMTEPDSSIGAYTISITILSLILISSVTFCLETLKSLETDDNAKLVFAWIEFVCIICFTAEYVTKIVVAPNRTQFFFGPLNMIDLVAILPWYFEVLTSSLQIKLQFVRVIRLVRVFRIMKLGGKFGKIQVVATAMSESMDMLGMLLFLLLIGIVIFSTLIYNLEKTADWDANSDGVVERGEGPGPFQSIPACFWWCMVTFMTVGYGDEYPVTAGGKLVACVAMIGSLLIVALPISVIGTNFTEEWMRYKERQKDEARKKLAPRFEDLTVNMLEFNITLEDVLTRLKKQSAEMGEQIVELKDRVVAKRRDKLKESSQEFGEGIERKWGSGTSGGSFGGPDESESSKPSGLSQSTSMARRESAAENEFQKSHQIRRTDKFAGEISEMRQMNEELIGLKEAMLRTLRVSSFMRKRSMLKEVNEISHNIEKYDELCDETGLLDSELENIESDAYEMYERWTSEMVSTGNFGTKSIQIFEKTIRRDESSNSS